MQLEELQDLLGPQGIFINACEPIPSIPDHAYVTMTYNSSMEIYVNDQKFALSDYWSNVDWINALYEAGLGMYDSFDNLGCWPLFRFQNRTNQPMEVNIRYGGMFGYGMMILEPQENQTIYGYIEQNGEVPNEGFNATQFTLGKDTTFIPDGFEYYILSPTWTFDVQIGNGQVGFQFQFMVNGVLVEDWQGNSTFDMGDGWNDLRWTLREHNVTIYSNSSTIQSPAEGSRNIFFRVNEVNSPTVVRVIQTAPAHGFRNDNDRFLNGHQEYRDLIEETGDTHIVEFRLYDPINLED